MKMTFILTQLFVVTICAGFFSCSSLSTDQIAKVKYEYYGDFGSEIAKITLFKKNDSTYAKLETEGESTQEVMITKAQLDSFEKFVVTFKALTKEGLCSSSISCTIYTKREKLSKENISCSWTGFRKLKSDLGFIKD